MFASSTSATTTKTFGNYIHLIPDGSVNAYRELGADTTIESWSLDGMTFRP